jgi:hypothetical protein
MNYKYNGPSYTVLTYEHDEDESPPISTPERRLFPNHGEIRDNNKN